MKLHSTFRALTAAAIGSCAAVMTSHAAMIPSYPTPGVENPTLHTFTATGTGDVVAYFAGSSANFGSKIGVKINGAPVMVWGLQNHSTPIGTSFVLGSVMAGDTLEFILDVSKSNPLGPPPSSYKLSSIAANNPGGSNHVYSEGFAGGMGLPEGRYVGFEDISPISGSDLDYNDHEFIFVYPGSEVVPDGGTTLALLGLATMGLPLVRRFAK